MPTSRREYLAAAGLAAVAGCLGNSAEGPKGPLSLPTADERLPLPAPPEKLRDSARSGGQSKDGIPSIDEPQFVDSADADFLASGDPVFGVARDSVAKAYPQKILAHHEIVNDTLAGTPVSVTYCPLTGTVQGFERGNTTFGVSGRLINSNLVMYDRHTETWWPQMLATSIPGPWNEDPEIRSLREFRLVWTTWEQWRDHNPDTQVLSTETGHAKNYNRDPYGSYNPRSGYYSNDNLLFGALNRSDRFDPKRVVMGLRSPGGPAAFLKDALRDAGQLEGQTSGRPVITVYDDRYDTGYSYLNPDGESFDRDGNRLVDAAGTHHEPDTLPLTRVHTFDAMWFAWAGYYPDTNVSE
jgi:predicted small lipoprotein YifL